MFPSSGGPGSRLRLMPSSIALMIAANDRYGLTEESTERYSNRPGALIRSAVVRFWKPQSAKIGAQNPASAKRRYEFTVGAVIAVRARRWARTPPMACSPILLGRR